MAGTSVCSQRLRAESERYWRSSMESLDRMEEALIRIYKARGNDPAAIDVFDEIISIIRRKDKLDDERVREIGELTLRLRGSRAPKGK
jgi:benzoyl-CoA reductase/2-hydroxyglutaryl-CoA dehydratase subunit BcrC/BadD/HgdB